MSNKVDKIKYDGMESLVTAIIVCDKDLIINYVNPSTETLFEVSAKQAANNNINIFFEDTNNFFKKILQKVDQQKNSYKEHEYFLQTHQKKTICVSSVSYTHLRAHETLMNLVCRLLLEKISV